jgi:Asp-tRNA(Asn)/Glu-tRNA(Gln) amidotransferase A subunit family amidase
LRANSFNTTARGFGAFFEDWDIILTPITALPTPRIGTTEYLTTSTNPSVLDWFHNLWKSFAYTPLTNLCGIPGVSLPLGWQDNGLPLGLQLIGKAFDEATLLRAAYAVETAADFKHSPAKWWNV